MDISGFRRIDDPHDPVRFWWPEQIQADQERRDARDAVQRRKTLVQVWVAVITVGLLAALLWALAG